ncbi:MAG: sigma 54-interacting transcriptional regulator, partial [Vicinamibacterales bacterium]
MPGTIISSSPATPEMGLEELDQLSVALSRRLGHLHLEEILPTIASTLGQIAEIVSVDACRLIEFAEGGAIAREHFPATPRNVVPKSNPLSGGVRWLIERLARGEVIAISRPEDLPQDAMAAREHVRRTGVCSVLGVPVSIAGQVVCAFVIDSVRTSRRWPQHLVERLQLLAEIMGVALQRARHEQALRASVEEVQRLNVRLEAANDCLKEEIKSYHDFDDIVGESPALRLALGRLGQVAPTDSSVLLLGPTGTGKELFARAVHERSRRRARALVRVNCAALPPTL